MPEIIHISGVTGGVPPLSFYICDENGNNCAYLGSSGGTFNVPAYYIGATTFMIKVVDSLECTYFTIVSCPIETFIILSENTDLLTTEDGFFLVFRDD